MAAVIRPFWKNPPPDFLGLSGRCSDRPPKHILQVSACFSKCPGFKKNPANLPVLMWNDVTMKALGKCRVKTVKTVIGQKWNVDYVIVDRDLTPLLSRKAAETMKLITINYDNFELWD